MNVYVVNLRARPETKDNTEARYIYIGRPPGNRAIMQNYGNPFSHLASSRAIVRVASREEAVQAFRDWLDGKAWFAVEPMRRLWILASLLELKKADKDITFGCFCRPNDGFKGRLLCHGQILAARVCGLPPESIE